MEHRYVCGDGPGTAIDFKYGGRPEYVGGHVVKCDADAYGQHVYDLEANMPDPRCPRFCPGFLRQLFGHKVSQQVSAFACSSLRVLSPPCSLSLSLSTAIAVAHSSSCAPICTCQMVSQLSTHTPPVWERAIRTLCSPRCPAVGGRVLLYVLFDVGAFVWWLVVSLVALLVKLTMRATRASTPGTFPARCHEWCALACNLRLRRWLPRTQQTVTRPAIGHVDPIFLVNEKPDEPITRPPMPWSDTVEHIRLQMQASLEATPEPVVREQPQRLHTWQHPGTLEVGQRVTVMWPNVDGTPYKAVVTQVHASGHVDVQYDEHTADDEYEKQVPLARVKDFPENGTGSDDDVVALSDDTDGVSDGEMDQTSVQAPTGIEMTNCQAPTGIEMTNCRVLVKTNSALATASAPGASVFSGAMEFHDTLTRGGKTFDVVFDAGSITSIGAAAAVEAAEAIEVELEMSYTVTVCDQDPSLVGAECVERCRGTLRTGADGSRSFDGAGVNLRAGLGGECPVPDLTASLKLTFDDDRAVCQVDAARFVLTSADKFGELSTSTSRPAFDLSYYRPEQFNGQEIWYCFSSRQFRDYEAEEEERWWSIVTVQAVLPSEPGPVTKVTLMGPASGPGGECLYGGEAVDRELHHDGDDWTPRAPGGDPQELVGSSIAIRDKITGRWEEVYVLSCAKTADSDAMLQLCYRYRAADEDDAAIDFFDNDFVWRWLQTRDGDTIMDPDWEGQALVGKTIQHYEPRQGSCGEVESVAEADEDGVVFATVAGASGPVEVGKRDPDGKVQFYGNNTDPANTGAELIGRRIALCKWGKDADGDGADDQRSPGAWVKRPFVIAFDQDTQEHTVRYEDKTEETLGLEPHGKTSWRFLLGW